MLAGLCQHIPPPGLHITRLHGACANRTRGARARRMAGQGKGRSSQTASLDTPIPGRHGGVCPWMTGPRRACWSGGRRSATPLSGSGSVRAANGTPPLGSALGRAHDARNAGLVGRLHGCEQLRLIQLEAGPRHLARPGAGGTAAGHGREALLPLRCVIEVRLFLGAAVAFRSEATSLSMHRRPPA